MTGPFYMPYRMHNSIRHYSWGSRGAEAFIPRLLGLPAEPGQAYAELWIGAHPSAPSQVVLNGERISLATLIASDPAAILGTGVARRFNHQLPFLFKVLSAAEPLSIQTHPDKAQAQRLHARDPEHYPDANHKPEIALALDRLTALAGLKSAEDLHTTLSCYPEIAGFIQRSGADPQRTFTALIRRALAAPQALSVAVQQLAERLERAPAPRTEVETLFLALHPVYGDGDVGLFALFLLNLVHLETGEGLYVPAGVPHAYLNGNIVECMANSDNVIRVGLTPKFKDAEALLEVLAPDSGPLPVLHPEPELPEMCYITPAEEFELRRLDLEAGAQIEMPDRASVEVYLLTEGRVDVSWSGGMEHYIPGESFLIPACLPEWQVTARERTTLFKVSVPE
ncbi:MAG: mannose-6-phosphate isomerase, class I [Anaerolineae bacterium]|nr:mannose-6-phosphate isomerase, class I [Anaerolineae bacterium]